MSSLSLDLFKSPTNYAILERLPGLGFSPDPGPFWSRLVSETGTQKSHHQHQPQYSTVPLSLGSVSGAHIWTVY